MLGAYLVPSSGLGGSMASSIRWYDAMQSFGASSGKVTTTIVLAEDESDLRALLAECLRRDGHVVWEASDGGQALSLVRAHAPALLLLDIWMPVLNGLEVLEHLGRSPEAVGMKVVVLSQLGDADTRLEGFALGVDDYWTKDFSLVELCARIQSLLTLAPIPPAHPG
jgi:DNA-binding response OmpR family regulator